MKKLLTGLVILLSGAVAQAQISPVTWSFAAVKIANQTYELHMKATIQPGWHLYSQDQPENAIAIPTGFTLNKNPLTTLDGKIKEVGKMEVFRDEKLDISANQYADNVDFVQIVKVKAKAKTNITGSVEYQTCDNKKCLPPKTVNFNISIQ